MAWPEQGPKQKKIGLNGSWPEWVTPKPEHHHKRLNILTPKLDCPCLSCIQTLTDTLHHSSYTFTDTSVDQTSVWILQVNYKERAQKKALKDALNLQCKRRCVHRRRPKSSAKQRRPISPHCAVQVSRNSWGGRGDTFK